VLATELGRPTFNLERGEQIWNLLAATSLCRVSPGASIGTERVDGDLAIFVMDYLAPSPCRDLGRRERVEGMRKEHALQIVSWPVVKNHHHTGLLEPGSPGERAARCVSAPIQDGLIGQGNPPV
jgi:hypothetical protein